MDIFEQVNNALNYDIGLGAEISRNMIITGIYFLVIFLIRWLIIKFFNRKVVDTNITYRIHKITNLISFFIFAFILFKVWVQGFGSVAAVLGLISAGLTVALKEPISCFAGWIYLLSKKQFIVGDRIEINGMKGDVIDISPMTFTMLELGVWVDRDQSTGRMVKIPNLHVFQHPLINYTRGFEYIWNEIQILVTFESNWQKAKKILDKVLDDCCLDLAKGVERQIRQARASYLIHYGNFTPIVYTSIHDSGVNFSLRYLVPVRQVRGSENVVFEEILTQFEKHKDIEFAYPTIRYFDNIEEGDASSTPLTTKAPDAKRSKKPSSKATNPKDFKPLM